MIELFDNSIFLVELCPHIWDLFCLPRQLKLCLLEFGVCSLSAASLLSHLLLQAPKYDTQTLDLSILRSWLLADLYKLCFVLIFLQLELLDLCQTLLVLGTLASFPLLGSCDLFDTRISGWLWLHKWSLLACLPHIRVWLLVTLPNLFLRTINLNHLIDFLYHTHFILNYFLKFLYVLHLFGLKCATGWSAEEMGCILLVHIIL